MRKVTLAMTIWMLGAAAAGVQAQQPEEQRDPKSTNNDGSTQAAPNNDVRPAAPHPNQVLILIRSTLLAVNQANLTGNYSVLRELGTPGFQQSNSSGRLSDGFKNLRDRNLDLSPVAVLTPQLNGSVNPDGRLRLTGFFPSRPERVNFDLAYLKKNERWFIDGIALNTARAQAAPARGSEPRPDAASASHSELAATRPAVITGGKPPAVPEKNPAGARDNNSSTKKSLPSSRKVSATQEPTSGLEERVQTLWVSPPAGERRDAKPKRQNWNPFSAQ